MTRRLLRGLQVGAALALVFGLSAPALAQQGNLRGKVVDESGKPVPEAEIVMDFVGDFSRQLKAVTDKNGEWIRAGMPLAAAAIGTSPRRRASSSARRPTSRSCSAR